MGSLGLHTSRDVFAEFEQHSAGNRVSTIVVLNASIRAHYPEYTVTAVSTYTCDLIGFAGAGHAVARLEPSEGLCPATRAYNRPQGRFQEGEGTFSNEYFFAKYKYTWEGHSFIVYCSECASGNDGSQLFSFIVCKPDANASIYSNPAIVDRLMIAISDWSSDSQDAMWVFDDGFWRKDKNLYKSVKEASWDDVILDIDTKDKLMKDVLGFFDSKDAYRRFGVPWKRGIILHGSPGNGKTLTIKATMNSLFNRPEPIPCLYVKSFSSCGSPEQSIAGIFSQAREQAPCFLVLEDLDSLVTDGIRSYFLNEVDGLQSNDGILILGSTNHLDKLDPAIVKRPSRFDRKYLFRDPDVHSRVLYAQYWKQKLESIEEVSMSEADCASIAAITEGFTFAYIKEAFIATLFHLFSHQEEAKAMVDPNHPSPFFKAFEVQTTMLREQMSEGEKKPLPVLVSS